MGKLKEKLKKLVDTFQNKVFKKVAIDDLLHSYASTCIVFLMFSVFNLFTPAFVALACSAVFTILLGYVKEEVIDKRVRGYVFSIRDLKSDLVGCGFGVVLLTLCILTMMFC